MIIYSVGDEFTGESKFHPSKKSAMEHAKSQANHHGHLCFVDRHKIGKGKAGLLRFLNYIPVERLHGDEVAPSPANVRYRDA